LAAKRNSRFLGRICSDTELGIGTSILASVVPLALPKMKHLVFIDAKAPKSVIDGVRMHKSNSRVQTYFYDEFAKSHLTMYFQTVIDGEILDLRSLFRNVPAQGKLFGSMIVFLDDRRGMGKIGPRSLGYLDLMEHHYGTNFLTDTFKHLKRKGHDNRRRILLRSVRPFRWLYDGARTDH